MEEFPKLVSLAQAGSSIFLGVAGFALAIVTAYWSYRNNFGWEPVVILGRLGLQGIYVVDPLGNINPPDGQPRYRVEISIEVWNYYQGRYVSKSGKSIAASSSDTRPLTIPFNVGDPDKVRSPIVVEVDCYDPRLNRVFTIRGHETYTIKGGLPLLPSSSNPQPDLKERPTS